MEAFIVSEEVAGKRLDALLAQHPDWQGSRERIQQLIKGGHVSVDGQPCAKAATRLTVGQRVVVDEPPPAPLQLPPWETKLDVIYEDAHLLVINKPRGMLTHPTGQQQPDTLVNALLHHCRGALSGINGVERPGIVHRLDRDTEGLLVVAKTDAAHLGLSQQLKAKTMRRSYYAVVQGLPNPEAGRVETGIARHPQQRNKMQVEADGRPAVTHYRTLETLHGRFSLLALELETGRTHQIRVHMAHLGHPLICDAMYGTGLEKNWRQLPQGGQALQAYALRFIHPVTDAPMAFEMPRSAYVENVLATLKKG